MTSVTNRSVLRGSLVGACALAGIVCLNGYLSRRATRLNPPKGQFVEVDGVSIHYVAMGDGPPLIILHGNGSMAEDFLSSDLVTMLAASHKVFIFDRPGYGHTEGGMRWWTAARQARLVDKVLTRLGISDEIVIAHSWGTLVALALSDTRSLKGMVLLSGYYFPSVRLDALVGGLPAMPGLGDLWRWTLGPVMAWLVHEPALKLVFSPSMVPKKFRDGLPLGLALRPKSLRSSAVEAIMMVPTAYELSKTYSDIRIPTSIVAGEEDKMVSPVQAERLCKVLPNASLLKLRDAGHMLHHTHASDVLSALSTLESVIQDRA